MPASTPAAQPTGPYGQQALPRDVELPGDPLPLRRWLAQQRLQRIRSESDWDRDEGGDDP
jgi:hypothetical protein